MTAGTVTDDTRAFACRRHFRLTGPQPVLSAHAGTTITPLANNHFTHSPEFFTAQGEPPGRYPVSLKIDCEFLLPGLQLDTIMKQSDRGNASRLTPSVRILAPSGWHLGGTRQTIK